MSLSFYSCISKGNRENEELKHLLSSLGYEVPKTGWAFQDPLSNHDQSIRPEQQPPHRGQFEARFGPERDPLATPRRDRFMRSSPPDVHTPSASREAKKRRLHDD